MRLTREQKNSELQKYLTLAHATFDYLIVRFGRQYVFDDVAVNEVMYKEQQVRAKNHFDERRLDKLKKMLKTETNWLGITSDVAFEEYIKKNTGYDIDLFGESFYQRNRESHDVLVVDNRYHEEVVHTMERIEKDGVVEIHGCVTVTEWDGPKPKHYKEREEIAPDGKHVLELVECTSGKYSSTTVRINFADTRMQVYHAVGIHPNINAYWKNNNTFVIETEKQYDTLVKYNKVENYGDVVHIEYIES